MHDLWSAAPYTGQHLSLLLAAASGAGYEQFGFRTLRLPHRAAAALSLLENNDLLHGMQLSLASILTQFCILCRPGQQEPVALR